MFGPAPESAAKASPAVRASEGVVEPEAFKYQQMQQHNTNVANEELGREAERLKDAVQNLGIDRDVLNAEIERLTADADAYFDTSERLKSEVEQLEALAESLQPQHHYMTKMGAELQEEMAWLHEENKRLKAQPFPRSSATFAAGMEQAATSADQRHC